MSTAVFLALRLGMPLLLEGEPGVGKTAAAQVLARSLDVPLVRLQCYEGLSAAEALYDWNYQRQLLAIRLAESHGEKLTEADLFSEEYLIERPVLRCVRYDGPKPPVLLVDEIDRADDEFEALLLEVLGEGSVTVPELGTFTAVHPPIVVLTSNRSRDLHDALRRRCLYHWLEYPEPDRVCAILRRTVPAANEDLISLGRAVRRPGALARGGQAARDGRGDQLGGGPVRPRRDRADARTPSSRPSARSSRPPTTATPCSGVWTPCSMVLSPTTLLRGVDRAALAAAFGDRLRRAGAGVPTTAMADLCEALGAAPPVRLDELYWSMRVTLVRRQPDLETFDRVFAAAFLETERGIDPHARRGGVQAPEPDRRPPGALVSVPGTRRGRDESEDGGLPVAHAAARHTSEERRTDDRDLPPGAAAERVGRHGATRRSTSSTTSSSRPSVGGSSGRPRGGRCAGAGGCGPAGVARRSRCGRRSPPRVVRDGNRCWTCVDSAGSSGRAR